MTSLERQDIDEILNGIRWEKFVSKNVLVTGATGAMARYVVHVLMEINRRIDDKGKVIVLCRNENKAKKCFIDYLEDSSFQIMVGAVEEPIKLCDRIDFIFHAAGMSASKYFKSNPVEILSANTVGTYNVLELAKEKKVEGVLFFSSCAVIGKLTDDYYKYTGVNPAESRNCYIVGKRVGENLCAAYYDEYNVPAKIVRIGYSFGPYVDLDDGHLFSDFLKSIINRETLVIKGTGKNYLGLCYVTDAVRAFFKIIVDGDSKTPYVMRNQEEVYTIESIAHILTTEVFFNRHLSYACETINGEEQEFTPIMPKLLMDLGWKPEVSLAEGFRRAVAIIEDNQDKQQ